MEPTLSELCIVHKSKKPLSISLYCSTVQYRYSTEYSSTVQYCTPYEASQTVDLSST